MSDEPRFSPAPPPIGQLTATSTDCDVAIVFGSSLESGSMEDRLQAVKTLRGAGFTVLLGQVAGRRVAMMRVSEKKGLTQAAGEAVLGGHRPRLVIAAGFATALSDSVARGDLVVADSILGPPRELVEVNRVLDRTLLTETSGVRVGRLLSLSQPVHRPAEKRQLGIEHQALAADRDSLVLAKLCRRQERPFAAVRAIVSGVDEELPPELERLASRQTAVQRIGAIAGSLVHRPSSIKDMWNMYETSLAASLRLAKFLEAAIERF